MKPPPAIRRQRRPRRPAALRSVCSHVLDKSRPPALTTETRSLCRECSLAGFGNALLRLGAGLLEDVFDGRRVTGRRISRALQMALRPLK